MWVSTRVEERLLALDRHPAWSVAEEAAAYSEALVQVVEEDEGRTWADGKFDNQLSKLHANKNQR
jgi:hypothetical protein